MRREERLQVIIKKLNEGYPKILKQIPKIKGDVKKLKWFFDLLEELKKCMMK